MTRMCEKCGAKLRKKDTFCSKCGEKATAASVNVQASAETQKQKSGTFNIGKCIAFIISTLIILVPAFVVTYSLITKGADFGRFEMDEIFGDISTIFSGKKTPFQKLLKTLDISSVIASVAIGLPCLGLAIWTDSRKKTTGDLFYLACGGLLCSFAYLCIFILLSLFDYTGIFRTVSLVLLYLLAAICVVFAFLICKNLGWGALFLNTACAIFGCMFALLIAPFIGVGLLFFGELFWIVLLFGIGFCGGTGGYVIYGRATRGYVVYVKEL